VRLLAAAICLVVVTISCGSDSATTVTPTDSLVAAVASAEPGDVLRLSPGRYAGPIILDQPITLIGAQGVVIEADDEAPAVLITSDHVAVQDVAIEGGRSGFEVEHAEDVVLDGVIVSGSTWHGFLVSDSQVTVSDCVVRGLTGSLPQGFEIRNSDARPPSLVRNCSVEGPVFEGFVSHVSVVDFVDNTVVGSTERGVAITEMSRGTMEGNRVENATGNAFYCGDMSRCSVVGNSAIGVASSSGAFRSAGGHGLVVHFHSEAFVEDLVTEEVDGEAVLSILDSQLLSERPLP